MTDQSATSNQESLTDLHNVTFSQASAAGLSHSGWLDGRMTEKSGQDHAPASPSALQEKEKAKKTKGTYGPLFDGSSPSASLQRSLENKLRQRMEGFGSPEYDLTWKYWDMKLGGQICALRASARRISVNDCGGLATPSAMQRGAHTGENAGSLGTGCRISEKGVKFGMTLETMATMAGWPTPLSNKLIPQTRKDFTPNLASVSLSAGWPTPKAQNANHPGEHGQGGKDLQTTAIMAGWPTASSRDWKDSPGMATEGTNPDGTKRTRLDQLPRVAQLSGYPTPRANDAEKRGNVSNDARNGLPGNVIYQFGDNPSGGHAETGNIDESLPIPAGSLNARFSLWLMGFPAEWAYCGEQAMQSSRKSQRNLLNQQ